VGSDSEPGIWAALGGEGECDSASAWNKRVADVFYGY
jgi:hypothetical protein